MDELRELYSVENDVPIVAKLEPSVDCYQTQVRFSLKKPPVFCCEFVFQFALFNMIFAYCFTSESVLRSWFCMVAFSRRIRTS